MFASFVTYCITERGPGAYRLQISKAEDQPLRDLSRTGPTCNDLVTFTGAHATERDAVASIMKLIGENCAIWRRDHHTGAVQYFLKPLAWRPAREDGATDTLLGRRTSHGTWLAN